ncbi:hypothetical protein [Bacillus safensis]|uniref:hypothetical protein n=1 Tax=Bacillus safensis TaxID=561879 RepID=UPI0015D4B6AE|nr:hypothetical protein [Bacillus safensis]
MKKRNLIITFLALVMLVSSVTLVFADDKEGDKTVKPKIERSPSLLIADSFR